MVEEEAPLQPLACLEAEEASHLVHREGALDLVDREETELVMTSRYPRPCYDLKEAGEEGGLSVVTTGSFREMAASRLVEEGEVLTERVTVLEHDC